MPQRLSPRLPFVFILIALMPMPLATLSRAAVTVSSVAALESAVANANAGGDPTILIAANPTPYNVGSSYFRIERSGITVRGAGKSHGDVVLDGFYQASEIFQIVASNVTIANMTLKRAFDHPVHIFPEGGNTSGIVLDNLHIVDPGQQGIKMNQNIGHRVVGGTIKNCLIELTDAGRPHIRDGCYTGGIDGNDTSGWTVQDNVVRGFWCETGLSEHGIHFWNGASDNIVERNQVIECDRGIGFGLCGNGTSGGTIRNNMVYHSSANHGFADVGIGIESAPGAKVYNNTVYLGHGYPNSIEYRCPETTTASGVLVMNNLSNTLVADRDGASAALGANNDSAQASWFVGLASGDLHLAAGIGGVVDAGLAVNGLADDFDGGPRPWGGGYDIGADEYGSTAPGSRPVTTSWMLLLME